MAASSSCSSSLIRTFFLLNRIPKSNPSSHFLKIQSSTPHSFKLLHYRRYSSLSSAAQTISNQQIEFTTVIPELLLSFLLAFTTATTVSSYTGSTGN
jgi:hypothetical protein